MAVPTQLHFGCDKGVTKLIERKLVLNCLLDHVSNLANDRRPTVVRISGDSGWRGNLERPEIMTGLACF